MCTLKWVSAVKPERVKLPVLKKKSPGINVPGLQRRPSTTQKCPILLAKKIYYKSLFLRKFAGFVSMVCGKTPSRAYDYSVKTFAPGNDFSALRVSTITWPWFAII